MEQRKSNRNLGRNSVALRNIGIDHDRAVEIGPGVWWVGFHDVKSGFHCNPYLIVDEKEAVLIDGGSRPDFPTVMMKIMGSGLSPQAIVRLIYQHTDPDLCGSIPNMEEIIGNPQLAILSCQVNEMFLRHYAPISPVVSLEEIQFQYSFSSGRTLEFTATPFAHAQGSFVTFDRKAKILFSSDLFGSYGENWQLFLDLPSECLGCKHPDKPCSRIGETCPLRCILEFHRKIMPSGECLRFALNLIESIPFEWIAPQHGSILDRATGLLVLEHLRNLSRVGIESYL